MSSKEPWEVFHDELRRQIARYGGDDASGGALTQIPEAAVPEMSTALANAVLEHLTDVEGLGQERALEVTKLFFAELSRESAEPIADRLRSVWQGWAENS